VELGETKLRNAEEKEKLFGEMQKLADALLQSREQIKESKETELSLRNMIQGYEEKFNGLQRALKDTNGSYEEFKSEMNKVRVLFCLEK
jgi:chromosome segregation ATPase